MGHPRRLQGDNEDVKGLEALVVPLERFEFDSWEDLESYLAEYAKGGTPELPYPHEEHSDCTQCQDSLNGVKNWFVPDEWVNYGKTYTCTHSGMYKSRGKGERMCLQSCAMECEAQIRLHLSWSWLGSVGLGWATAPRVEGELGRVGTNCVRGSMISYCRSMRVSKSTGLRSRHAS
ncbi:hypothetical protein DVH05_026119 [Phytophthora capsici]|nr:hypothetical protein DVH05_026119 [Phytophthora capsici]